MPNRRAELYNAGTPMLSMTENASLLSSILYVHFLQILSNLERSLGLCLDLINSNTLGIFPKCQALYPVNVEDREIRDDSRNALGPSERKCTLVENLGVALFVNVLHCDDNLRLCGICDEVHGTAYALDFAGKHEICKI